jgi:hypothetical protein
MPHWTNSAFSQVLLLYLCLFVAAETCLPNRCTAMDVRSGSTIPALRYHVTLEYICLFAQYIRLRVEQAAQVVKHLPRCICAPPSSAVQNAILHVNCQCTSPSSAVHRRRANSTCLPASTIPVSLLRLSMAWNACGLEVNTEDTSFRSTNTAAAPLQRAYSRNTDFRSNYDPERTALDSMLHITRGQLIFTAKMTT